jgi:NADH-quinone oxidoreductase subunit E
LIAKEFALLYEKHRAEIDAILAKYPSRRSAVLPLLYIAQDAYGRLDRDSIREVAEILDLPYTDVFEVVGFYTLFYNESVGKIVLDVCDDVPCCFCGAEELVADLEGRLGVKAGATTSDGMFTLRRVKCIAACDQAPVLQANLEFHNKVTPDKVAGLLADLRRQVEEGRQLSISGRFAEH